MNIDLSFLPKKLIGTTVPKPASGTLSGHAAGEPFDKHAYAIIKEHYPGITYRQFEYLNELYGAHPEKLSHDERQTLIENPAIRFLLNRGVKATQDWTSETPFEEKQNDTADILVVKDSFFNVIDIKTHYISKAGQPPNIISAYKLAQMCALMLQSGEFSSHDITYVDIAWQLEGQELKCVAVEVRELFKTDPSKLYINWAAAMQIQFHVASLDQNYSGTTEDWCRDYLKSYVKQAAKRTEAMRTKFIEPFEDLI